MHEPGEVVAILLDAAETVDCECVRLLAGPTVLSLGADGEDLEPDPI